MFGNRMAMTGSIEQATGDGALHQIGECAGISPRQLQAVFGRMVPVIDSGMRG